MPAGYVADRGVCGHEIFGSQFSAADLEDAHLFRHHYRDNFLQRPHVMFVGVSETDGPIVAAVQEQTSNPKALVRTKNGDHRLLVPHSRPPREALLAAMPSLATPSVNLWKCADDSLRAELAAYEHGLLRNVGNYKFGVLYQRAGQTTEVDMYTNNTVTGSVSPEYTRFLSFLGDTITLKGWTKYRGGLNVKENLTGTHSVYRHWENYEIMFHVATLIPFYEKDVQQVERKRHLGNDVVIVVFQDPGAPPFDPTIISSHFNHVFMVVQQDADKTASTGTVHYWFQFVCKQGTLPFGPTIPGDRSLPFSPNTIDLMMAKLINAERAAMYAREFKGKFTRTREELLNVVVSKFPEKAATAVLAEGVGGKMSRMASETGRLAQVFVVQCARADASTAI